MHFIAALATLGLAATFWLWRIRDAASAVAELWDQAERLAGAVRRARFRARAEIHPVEAIEDWALAAGGLTLAFAALAGRLGEADRVVHLCALQAHLGVTLTEAEEILALGAWFISECGGPEAATTRLARKLYRLGGRDALDPALDVMGEVARATGGLTDRQRTALSQIRRIFGR